PAYAIAAMLAGLAIGQARTRLATVVLSSACLMQLALLGYDPRGQIPRAADRAAGDALVALLASTPGDVLVPYHGRLSSAAGKGAHAHLMQVFDVLTIGDARGARLADDFRSTIRRRDFGAIVLDDRSQYVFRPDVDASYELKAELFHDPGVFYPVTGGL